MTEPIDPVTSALTGKLPFYLLLAAVLTWPIALAVLKLYARAVRRSMRQTHGVSPAGRKPDTPSLDDGQETAAGTLFDLSEPPGTAGTLLFAQLLREPRRAAFVYAVAGLAYGAVMAASQLLADGLEILPLRFLFLTWIFSWPVVLTVGVVAASTRPAKAATAAVYFLGLAAMGATAMARSPDLTWGQVVLAWILYDVPATILLLLFLSRRIRAVGPLILTFILLALIGSDVALSVVGSRLSLLGAIVRLTSSLGVGGTGTLFAVMVVGFLLFTVVGWAALLWIGRRYQDKRISDESVTVDAIWMLFTTVHSINLVFGHPLWTVGAVAAFGAYTTMARVGFWWLRRTQDASRRQPTLLVLRSFSIGSDSERLFDDLGRRWRRVGSMQMIAGIDLVSRTVEPHEFLDFVSGRLSRRFIDGEESLDRRMRERDIAPDRDLRFRVNEFFCYDDTWKMVLSRLVHESDVVVMDLRGFSRENAGCVFELHELARQVPLERVVFVTDRRTDEALLARALGPHRVGVFRLGATSGRRTRQLLRAIAAAATATAAARVSGPSVGAASG